MDFTIYLLCFIAMGIRVASSHSLAPNLVGSTAIPTGEVPKFKYMAVLIDETKTKVYCGAFILSPTWILTAAHCAELIETESSQNLLVNIGERSSRNNTMYQFIRHPNYNKANRYNDIAIIEISPLEFGEEVNTIPLAEKAVKEGTSCTVSGFGAASVDEEPSLELRHTEVTFERNCKGLLAGQMCSSPSIMCEGDAGSPLVCNGELVGMGISDNACNTTAEFDTYIDIFKYKTWIETNARSSAMSFLLSPFTLITTFTVLKITACA